MVANRGEAQQQGNQDQQGRPAGRDGRTPLVEWIAAGVSAVLVLAMLGYTVHEAIRGDEGPPDLSVRSDSIVRVQSGFVVTFTVRNDGGGTAASATIGGTLLRGDSVLERSAATIDYVPDQGSRAGGLLFTHDPARDSLSLRVEGFQMP